MAEKTIKLKADPPLYNYVDVRVIDFTAEGERERCKITCEFGRYDVEQLKKKGMSFEEAIGYYRDWLYNVIKIRLAMDWECHEGYDEVMEIIRENVKRFY